jgi:hypothetical protein
VSGLENPRSALMGRSQRGRIGGEGEAALRVPGENLGLLGGDAEPLAEDRAHRLGG